MTKMRTKKKKMPGSKNPLRIKNRGPGGPYYLAAKSIPPDEGDWNELTNAQRLFITHFMVEMDLQRAIDKADIKRSTYERNWARNDNFRAVFHKAQRDMVQTAQHVAKDQMMRNILHLIELRDQGEDKRTSLQATKTLMEAANDPTLTGGRGIVQVSNPWILLAQAVVLPMVKEMEAGANLMEDYTPPELEAPAFYDTEEEKELLEQLEVRAAARDAEVVEGEWTEVSE